MMELVSFGGWKWLKESTSEYKTINLPHLWFGKGL